MSFWEGLSKGIQDSQARKEREGIAQERSDDRDYLRERNERADSLAAQALATANSRYETESARFAASDARDAEAHASSMTTASIAQGSAIRGLASGGGGVGSGGGSSSTSTSRDMALAPASLTARIESAVGGGIDEMSSTDQAFFRPILDNPAASYELDKLLDAAVGNDEDLDILNASQRVRAVAIVKAQGQEEWNSFLVRAEEDGWDADEVAEAMELSALVNPAFAKLILVEPSTENLTEEETRKTFEGGFVSRVLTWADQNPELAATSEYQQAAAQLEDPKPYTQQMGMNALVGMGVGNDWIRANAKEGSALYGMLPRQVAPIPTTGEVSWTGTIKQLDQLTQEEAQELDGKTVEVPGMGTTVFNYNPDVYVGGADATTSIEDDQTVGPDNFQYTPEEVAEKEEIVKESMSAVDKAFASGGEDTAGILGALTTGAQVTLRTATNTTGWVKMGFAVASAYTEGLMGRSEYVDHYRDLYEAGEAASKLSTQAVLDSWESWFKGSPEDRDEERERVTRMMDGVLTSLPVPDELGARMETPTIGKENLRTDRTSPETMSSPMDQDSSSINIVTGPQRESTNTLREVLTNDNISQEVKDETLKKFELGYGREATVQAVRGLPRTSESQDSSAQDSQDLVAILTDPNADLNMKIEARRVFEEKYGTGSVDAAIEMVNKS